MAETFVHVWLATVEPQTADEVVELVRETARQVLPTLYGLKSVSVLLSEDRKRVAYLTEWNGRHDWGRAQWDAQMQDRVVALFRSAKHVESQVYRDVFHYSMTSESM